MLADKTDVFVEFIIKYIYGANNYLNVEAFRRMRLGLNGVLHKPLGWINADFNYHKMAGSTGSMISKQIGGEITKQKDSTDLFEEDVKLIYKDGKCYHLTISND